MKTALAFDIQRFRTDDGPGIRTTVLLKGCPLHCAWCHTPEGLRPAPQLIWHETRCIGTRECLGQCTSGALAIELQGMRINRQLCNACGDCAAACPATALEVVGRHWDVGAMRAELLGDRVFYESSGGGVTFSGGEPLLQVDFLLDLLPLCRYEGIHIALDTSGAVPWEQMESVLPYVDLVLYDLKLIDDGRHRAATGWPNVEILENARRLAAAGVPMWIRTPVVPGYTADDENIAAIAHFIAAELPTVRQWDLLPYISLGRPKYQRLDRTYALNGTPSPSGDEMERVWRTAQAIVPTARCTGADPAG